MHWCYDAAFADEFPEIAKTDEVIMLDRRCYTVSGAAAAFDLALMLIEALSANWIGIRQSMRTPGGG